MKTVRDDSAPEGVPAGSDREVTELLDLDDRPETASAWLASMWGHRHVLAWLARSDFHIRYRRASFGIAWSVVLPMIQSTVLIVVFSRFTQFNTFNGYKVFVLTGVACWSFFAAYVGAGSTAIVDQSGLTDKVWFPRGLLPLVPGATAAVGLLVTLAVVVALAPALGTPSSARLLLLPVAIALLFTFASALTLVLAALHVYFRDVRYLVQAAMVVWFWVTPVAYPQSFAGGIAGWLSLNPMTGIVTLFRMATVGADRPWMPSVATAVASTLALLVIAVHVHRRHDRLFVDLL